LEDDGEEMGAALRLVDLVCDDFEGETGCDWTLNSG
jgi:hypothetical protein